MSKTMFEELKETIDRIGIMPYAGLTVRPEIWNSLKNQVPAKKRSVLDLGFDNPNDIGGTEVYQVLNQEEKILHWNDRTAMLAYVQKKDSELRVIEQDDDECSVCGYASCRCDRPLGFNDPNCCAECGGDLDQTGYCWECDF